MAHNHWLDSPDDIAWLNETHLRNVELPEEFKDFKSAILQGNEDCPYAINLYNNPNANLSDDFCRVVFTDDKAVITIYSGETGEPR